MLNKQRFTTVFIILTIIALGYFMYERYLKEIILNNTTRTIQIEKIIHTKLIKLKKQADQANIYSLELEITGKSDRTILFFFGPNKDQMQQQILLKKGKVDYHYSGDWYSNECYIYFPSENGSNTTMKLDYRFIGGSK